MKKMLAMLFAVAFLAVARVQANPLETLYDDVVDQARITVMESATPAYFYDARNGISKAGVSTSLFEYRFVTCDAGWITPLDASGQGAAVIGGGVRVDRLLNFLFPATTSHLGAKDFSQAAIPESAYSFWSKVAIGFFTAHDFDRDERKLVFGPYVGLNYRF